MSDDKPVKSEIANWDCTHNWRRITERRLAKIHAELEGLHAAHAARVVDVVEDLETLRGEVKDLADRFAKMRAFVIEKLKGRNGQ